MKTVAAAIIKNKGKILIAKRKAGGAMGGKWEFPGGKVEKDESPKQALKRELKEEFDVDAKVGEYFDYHIHRYRTGPIKVFAFMVKLPINEISLSDHDEVRWISKGEMNDYDFVGNDSKIVEKLACES